MFDVGCAASVNHGVVAVGFGTDNGEEYWIIKNSWGGEYSYQ